MRIYWLLVEHLYCLFDLGNLENNRHEFMTERVKESASSTNEGWERWGFFSPLFKEITHNPKIHLTPKLIKENLSQPIYTANQVVYSLSLLVWKHALWETGQAIKGISSSELVISETINTFFLEAIHLLHVIETFLGLFNRRRILRIFKCPNSWAS